SDCPSSFCEHLFRERLIRELLQKEAASLIGVSVATYIHWETGQHEPRARQWPAVIRFLGYDPHPAPTTFGDAMASARRAMGWTIREAAQQAGIDESTWSNIESQRQNPFGRIKAQIEMILCGEAG